MADRLQKRSSTTRAFSKLANYLFHASDTPCSPTSVASSRTLLEVAPKQTSSCSNFRATAA
eukprot:2316354-Prorocentrum_lima.AAC.1